MLVPSGSPSESAIVRALRPSVCFLSAIAAPLAEMYLGFPKLESGLDCTRRVFTRLVSAGLVCARWPGHSVTTTTRTLAG